MNEYSTKQMKDGWAVVRGEHHVRTFSYPASPGQAKTIAEEYAAWSNKQSAEHYEAE